jgi:hypothetical protein
MKIRSLSSLFLLLVIAFASCKKEAAPGIVGQWISESFYQPAPNGTFGWVSPSNYTETLTLTSSHRFAYFTDVPGKSGTYLYKRNTGEIDLNVEFDNGTLLEHSVLQVLEVSQDRLVVAYSDVPEYKIRYIRSR